MYICIGFGGMPHTFSRFWACLFAQSAGSDLKKLMLPPAAAWHLICSSREPSKYQKESKLTSEGININSNFHRHQ